MAMAATKDENGHPPGTARLSLVRESPLLRLMRGPSRHHELFAANPRVAFTLQGDPYGDHMLSVEGIATPDPSLPPQDQVASYMTKYREPLAHWGMDPAATAREFSRGFRIRPTRVRTF